MFNLQGSAAPSRIVPAGIGKTLRGGFTLIELIILLVLITLCSLVIVPRFLGSREQVIGGAILRDLETKIRYAQYHAVLEGSPYLLQYDRNRKNYQFMKEDAANGTNDWKIIRERWARAKAIPEPFELSARGGSKVCFFPDGSMSGPEISLLCGKREIAVIRFGHSLGTFEIRWKK